MFYIQVSNPKIIKSSESAEEISEALEYIFPLHTEYALIFIEGCVFRISYKYDLGIILSDLIDIVEWVLNSYGGSYFNQFGSNTFSYKWEIEKSQDTLKIGINDEIAIKLGYPMIDDKCKYFEVKTADFLGEWRSLFEKILLLVEESEIQINNPTQTEELKRLVDRIETSGIMYR